MTIAALYVDAAGPYFGREGVDPWDRTRDAKRYAGPHPVVAHPECGPWGRLRFMCTLQDPTCGPRAVEQVRAYGGVLEHPAYSTLWGHCGLPDATDCDGFGETDEYGGRTYYVEQVDYGHACRKATWLYVVGSPAVHPAIVRELDSVRGRGTPTHVVCTSTRRDGSRREVLPSATRAVRKLTPPAFADLLIRIARACRLREVRS